MRTNTGADTQNEEASKSKLKVLDLCTGSGCIPLLLSHLLPSQIERVVGVDISPSAISLARDNSSSLGINDDVVTFAQLDIMAPSFPDDISRILGGRADVITCNPPYISNEDYARLPDSVRKYEDPYALLGTVPTAEVSKVDDGLDFYRRIARLLPDLSSPSARKGEGRPRVMLEIGESQGEAVRDILIQESAGMIGRAEVWQDQYDKPRAVVGWT